MEIQINKVKCLRCGHEWIPRVSTVVICAKCKSPYWDRPRPEKKEKEGGITNEN